MTRIAARYDRAGLLTVVVLALVLGAPLAVGFVLLVPDTSVPYKLIQVAAVELVAVSYIAGPKYADHLVSKDSQGL